MSHEPVSSMPISPGPSQQDVTMPSSRTRSSTSSEKTFDVLFDILSQQKVDSGDTFDEAFYLDQKGPRKLWISKELNPDFQHQLEQQQKTEANKERRRRLACGETSETQHDIQHDDLSDDELQDEDFEETDLAEFMEASMTCSTPEVSDRP